MSRPLRIEYKGAWYHVMNHGRRSERIFEGRKDYLHFMELMKDATELWETRISAFCLMPNHYHMVVHTPRGNISRCMRHIDGVYTQRFNRRHGFDGPLFRGRFKSILIDGDSYLLHLVRYIHKNPLRAGIVESLGQYPWSSHQGYLSRAKQWDWLYKDFILSMLSQERGTQLRAYQQFMKREDSEEIVQLFESKKRPTFVGNEEFAGWLREKFFEDKRDTQVPESGELSPDIAAIKMAVCTHYGVTQAELVKSRRGRFNEAKSMAIYLARMLRKDTLMDIGPEFGLCSYSSVSSVLQGMRKQLQKNRKMQKRYEDLKKALNIGQTET